MQYKYIECNTSYTLQREDKGIRRNNSWPGYRNSFEDYKEKEIKEIETMLQINQGGEKTLTLKTLNHKNIQ